MNYPPIETQRLTLRTLTLVDTKEVCAHYSDPKVIRFITDTEPCANLKDAEDIIIYHQKDTGCRYGLFLKPGINFVGTCGYHCWRTSPNSIAEVGYDLSPAHWGKGYMREAMTALIGFGFDSMNLTEIEAFSVIENTRSIQLLQGLGFAKGHAEQEGDFRFFLRQGEWHKQFET